MAIQGPTFCTAAQQVFSMDRDLELRLILAISTLVFGILTVILAKTVCPLFYTETVTPTYVFYITSGVTSFFLCGVTIYDVLRRIDEARKEMDTEKLVS